MTPFFTFALALVIPAAFGDLACRAAFDERMMAAPRETNRLFARKW
jgi:hypothetical protein